METPTNTQTEESPIQTLDQHQPADPPTLPTEDHLPNTDPSPTLQQPPSSTASKDESTKDSHEPKSVEDSAAVGAPMDSATNDNSNNNALVSDMQKKIRRAERFGMAVQLSEEEKRNSRAERFGTASSAHGSDALKKSEQQKRKARADRFGLVQSVSADEEAKKKARLARFAAVSKTNPLEEEKKKARAIRFSQPPSSALSQVSGEAIIEPNTVIAGKAGGGA
ncbi:protein MODIFIER OF SNC1 11-like [Cornus florida]|uniref:protein MODIFIER OF SNC1 11-like n=1 Tax=Cornus florida TaxID=4283 RepID=UPI00289BBB80|nr:protein MODIFIER OF SNC1 11-like [Cornus florida]